MLKLKSCSRNWVALALIVALLALVAVGCSQPAENNQNAGEVEPAAEPVTLLISAAASLTDVMAELEELYREDHPQVSFTDNFGSSGKLQQQIEQGAPADVFMSAATDKMDALEEKDLIVKESRKDILKNQIVLVVAKDNSTITGFDTLNTATVIALGEPESVPAGKYAKESLTSMGLWEQIEPKVVYAQNVRQVLSYVESGDAEAGIVYQTDAKISELVKVVAAADEATHSSLVYPAAVVKDSQNQEAAQEFVDFLSGAEAQAVFEEFGFAPIK